MDEINVPASLEMKEYFQELKDKTLRAYGVAQKARAKGFDPEEKVDIPLAASVPERVEGLISAEAPQIMGSGVAKRILDLEKQYGIGDWRVALIVSNEVASEKFCKFKDKQQAINIGIKVGFAYVTLGIVAAPLEGLVEAKFKKRRDGQDYLALYYAGPVRGAGGTASAVSIIIADYVRRCQGIADYDITDEEVKRYQIEILDYTTRVAHRQYVPNDEEMEMMVRNMKVEVTGDPTEEYEVSQFKRLERVETTFIRGGMALVLTEGPSLKAEKLWKKIKVWGKDFNLDNWFWLEDFIKLKTKIHTVKTSAEDEKKVLPIDSYLSDIVAGRPVFAYPMQAGGFRIRYGRCRNSGFASMAISPITMRILNNYIATGTQLKVERPGKATTIQPCDTIEGPRVRLKNGDFVWIESEEEAKKLANQIDEITFLGDVLISYGDFSENGKRLVPPGYCEEWYALELKKVLDGAPAGAIESKILSNPTNHKLSFKEAFSVSQKYRLPLHPRHTFHWADISKDQLLKLATWLANQDEDFSEAKRVLELVGCPHKVHGKSIVFDEDFGAALFFSLGLSESNNAVEKINTSAKTKALEIINELASIEVRDRSGTYVGMRMGRPEKAKMRELKGSPHSMFPVGKEGDRTRSVEKAIEAGKVTSDFPMCECKVCNKITIYPICEVCGSKTEKWRICPVCKRKTRAEKCHKETLAYERRTLDIAHYFECARRHLGIRDVPTLVKGVRGTSNKDHIAENLAKAILRARHQLRVNKDNTIRYDVTEAGVTHFRPAEIETSVEKLKQLGYAKDLFGKELCDENQLVELRPQDVILPACEESGEEGAGKVLQRTANFVDELLEKFYKIESFYKLRKPEDLVGHVIIGLAPHTSAGIVGRVIGFSKTQCGYSHHFWHAAQRRNFDGDETCFILAMDAFLNFSRQMLPDRRGGRSMDSPLVLTTVLDPTEIDDEVHGMDIVNEYPLEFYQAALECKWPWDVKIEQVRSRLSTPAQYQGLGFTHDVSDINIGVRVSAYKYIPAMLEKMDGQMELARRIRAVDATAVATLVIEKHFLKDIKGNLRKFSKQQYRCTKCNEKYRRTPLSGMCSCGGNLIFTISEGSVRKYLEPSIKLAKENNVSPFLKQTLDIILRRVESLFGKEATKQISLGGFM